MDYILSIVLLLLLLLLLWCHAVKKQYIEGFSLSKKPMEADWSLLNRGPFDDVDYITPVFYPI